MTRIRHEGEEGICFRFPSRRDSGTGMLDPRRATPHHPHHVGIRGSKQLALLVFIGGDTFKRRQAGGMSKARSH